VNRYGSVYLVTNTVTREQYVGQTRQKSLRRWKTHINTANSSVAKKYKLASAINIFGKDNFSFQEVFVAFDADALNKAEIDWIKDINPAYNITKGGAGHKGVKYSEEVCKARSERLKRQWADPEWRGKQVANLKEIFNTPEARERGKKLIKFNGGAIRWAGHAKKEKAPKKEKVVKLKRDPKVGRENSARAKWKPLYCPELQCSFLSQKAAGEFLGVKRTTLTMAIKRKGKVLNTYTLETVA